MEQQPMKVYELAKELGIPPLALLEQLNALNIKVKSHMSDLGTQEVETARSSLKKKTSSSSSASSGAPKKTVVKTKKKAAATDTPSTPPAAASSTSAEKTTATAAATPGATETAASKAGAAAAASQAGSAIIRRRVKQDGSNETSVVSGTLPPSIPPGGPTEEQAVETASFESEEIASSTAYYEAEAANPAETTDAKESVAASLSQEEPVAPESAPSDGEPTIVKRAAVILPPRPQAPARKSFLKIVQPAAPTPVKTISKPSVQPVTAAGQKTTLKSGTGASQDKDGFRIIRMNKETLDQMAEEEAAKKRGGGVRGEAEIRPEDVRFADYRKKELVFLPKKKKIPVGKELKRTQLTTPKATKRVVEMGTHITVQDLASQLNVKAADVIRKLMGMGQMATINQSLDFDTTSLIATEYQYEVKNTSFKEETLLENTTTDAAEDLEHRPPIVTIMGHVDHGKTSLLDAIRSANVAAGEAGGITQHIGAYTVEQKGKKITFIDTPGHEAFAVMRARGANATDIVILVVAADDGVMPQTREALSHAQAAGVPIIVAINKIDKPGANPERARQALSDLGLVPEDWGGETMFIPVSALKRQNLDQLLEAILLQAEVLDLKANPEAKASGVVLETKIEKGRGPVVSLLVKRGTLRVGDAIVSAQYSGRVKALLNDKGQSLKEVTPGTAAEVLGFEGAPNAGEKFDSVATEADARKISESRTDAIRAQQVINRSSTKVSLEDLFSKIQTGTVKELGVIVKADVFGSAEAVRDSLVKLSNSQVKVKILHSAAGGITESDVLLATASQAVIIGFNVRPETKARQLAEAEHIEIKCYNIIYELIDDVKKAMAGLLEKKKVERFLGRAEVRQTFTVPKIGLIAGSAVVDGKILRGANVRLLRDSRIIYEGKMHSLKRFKDDAKEVATGYECGIGLENYNDVKPGDIIEAYQIDLITPELEAT